MSKTTPPSPKTQTLRQRASLNPRPEAVQDSLFVGSDFFDPQDLVQVKYEMLRRVHIDGEPISRSAKAFGFSRPAFYQAQADFEKGGLPGLVPKKRGPRSAHKLSDEVVDFLQKELADNSSLHSVELVRRVQERFGTKVHRRSLERALIRRKKKLPPHPPRE